MALFKAALARVTTLYTFAQRAEISFSPLQFYNSHFYTSTILQFSTPGGSLKT